MRSSKCCPLKCVLLIPGDSRLHEFVNWFFIGVTTESIEWFTAFHSITGSVGSSALALVWPKLSVSSEVLLEPSPNSKMFSKSSLLNEGLCMFVARFICWVVLVFLMFTSFPCLLDPGTEEAT